VRRYYDRIESIWWLLVGAALILAACKGSPTIQPTDTPSATSESSITESVPTTTPIASPTASSEQNKVILIGSQELDSELPFADIQALLQELASTNDMQFETLPVLTPEDLTEEMAVVVALPPDPGIAALAAAGSSTQFLAVGIPGVEPAGNLSVIDGDSARPDRSGFVAGYLAGVISKEWRVGMIGIADSEQAQMARQGFINGVTFFCGLCRSPYPPFYTYPILVDLPSSASPAESQAAAEAMISQAVNTVFVYPGAGDQALLDTLAQAEVAMIGGVHPASALHENWVATIQVGPLPAIREIWPELLNGRGGISRSLAISLVDRNESLFSPGRQHLVDQFLSDLRAGFIDTGVSQPTP